MIDEAYIRARITALRMKMGVSEYKMSLDIGRSKGYIQCISSGRSLPSLSEFLYICEYFGITPQEFFDEAMPRPQEIHRLSEAAKGLSEADLTLLTEIAERLQK